jgi:very-short-patch-repair endonuclease
VNQTAFNRVSSKHVDFVLCDPSTLAPVVAIELDDSTHYRRDRADRDAFVNQLFKVIGVSLIRHRVQSAYDTDAIARWIDAELSRSRPPRPSTPLRPAS